MLNYYTTYCNNYILRYSFLLVCVALMKYNLDLFMDDVNSPEVKPWFSFYIFPYNYPFAERKRFMKC